MTTPPPAGPSGDDVGMPPSGGGPSLENYLSQREPERKEQRARARAAAAVAERMVALVGENDPGWPGLSRLHHCLSEVKEFDKTIRRNRYALTRYPAEDVVQNLNAEIDEVTQKKSAVMEELRGFENLVDGLLRQERERTAFEERFARDFDYLHAVATRSPHLEEHLGLFKKFRDLEDSIVSQCNHLKAVERLAASQSIGEASATLESLREERRQMMALLPPEHPLSTAEPAGSSSGQPDEDLSMPSAPEGQVPTPKAGSCKAAWASNYAREMGLVRARLSHGSKAKVLQRLHANNVVLPLTGTPPFLSPAELAERDCDAVLNAIARIFEDAHLRRMVVERFVGLLAEKTGYVGSQDIVDSMAEVASMKQEPDADGVRLPDFREDKPGKSAQESTAEEDKLAFTTRMLSMNDKVDEHVADLDSTIRDYFKALSPRALGGVEMSEEATANKRRKICESVDESEREDAACLIKSLWDGWKLDGSNIEFCKDDVGLPYTITEGACLRGTVYEGKYRPHGAASMEPIGVAIKVLDYPVEITHRRSKVLREAQILDSVRHPHIVAFHGACFPREGERQSSEKVAKSSASDSDFVAWIVTELVRGTLQEAVKRGYVRSRSTKLSILCAIADALDHLHTKHIAHQGINAESVLVDVAEEEATGKKSVAKVKLSEFGVSRFARDAVSRSRSAHANDKSRTSAELAFRAPEMLRHDDPLAFPADVWGFAALCTYVFAGTTAAKGMSWNDLMAGALSGELSRESKRFAETIEFFELRRLCIRCFSHNPGDRPSMREVYLMVREFATAESVTTRIPIEKTIADDMHALWKKVAIRVESPALSVAGQGLRSPSLVVYRCVAREDKAVCLLKSKPFSGAGKDTDSLREELGWGPSELSLVYPCDGSNVGENEDREEYVVELWEGDRSQPSNLVGTSTVTLEALVIPEEESEDVQLSTQSRFGTEPKQRLNCLTFDSRVVPGISLATHVTLFLEKGTAEGLETMLTV